MILILTFERVEFIKVTDDATYCQLLFNSMRIPTKRSYSACTEDFVECVYVIIELVVMFNSYYLISSITETHLGSICTLHTPRASWYTYMVVL